MMTWKSTAAVSGAGLLLTWLANVPAQNTPAAPRAAASRPAATRAVVDIQEQAERLRSRIHASPDYAAPSRNPFRFGAVPMPPAHRDVVARPALPMQPLAPPVPIIKLSGIAVDYVNGREERTAILNTPSGLVFAHEGDEVAGQFRVGTVSEDGVELIDAVGSVLRIR